MRFSHLYFNMNFRWFYARFRLRTDFHHLNHHQDQKRSKPRSALFTRAQLAIQGKKRSAFPFGSQGQLLLAKNASIKQHRLHSVSKHGGCHNSLIRSLSFLFPKLLMLIICQALKYTLREMQRCLTLSKNFYSVGKKPEVEREEDKAKYSKCF